VKDRVFDLDLTAFPELLHDLPVQDSSQKNPLAGCWYDKWKLADVQPLRRVWFGELRDKYGTAARPRFLIPEQLRTLKSSRIGFCRSASGRWPEASAIRSCSGKSA
jgi:hypothetical protein